MVVQYFANIPFRYFICFVVTSAMTLIYGNIYILNFTVLCMAEKKDMNEFGNMTDVSLMNATLQAPAQFEYSKREKDLLFSAGYVGQLPAMLPLYYMIGRLGVRWSLMIVGCISAISTLLSPMAAHAGFYWFILARVLQGIPAACVSPAIAVVTSHWSTLAQNGVYVAILAAHFQIAPLVTMPLSAGMCVSPWGWYGVYYVQGFLTLLFILAFFVAYSDHPKDSRFISYAELKEIEAGKSHEEKNVGKEHTPYIPILKTISIWGIWITSVGGTIGFSIFLQYGPTYLNKVLHYNLEMTGWTSAIPYVFSCLARIFAQPLTANCDFLGERLAAIVSTTISQGTMALSFIVLVLIPQQWSAIAQVCYSLVIVANGLNGVGITRSAQLICKQHLRFVYTIRAMANASVGLLLPLFVNFMAPDDTHSQWSLLFLVIFIITLGTNIFFAIVADVNPAPWTTGTAELDITSMEEQNSEGDEEEKREHRASFKYQRY